MASQSQGIQQLLQAEKRAAEKVADARKRKARRLKQAKEEAQMEVDQYRREREQEFQSKQQAAMGSQGNLSAEVEQATRRQVQGMQSSQQRNRERVLAQLLGMVCDVRPQAFSKGNPGARRPTQPWKARLPVLYACALASAKAGGRVEGKPGTGSEGRFPSSSLLPPPYVFALLSSSVRN